MYHVQDKVVRMMRDLANTRNIHITIVCHPRKTMVSPKSGLQVLNEYDIAGRARAIQEADNILILQTQDMTKGTDRKDWIQDRDKFFNQFFTIFSILKVQVYF